MRREFWIILAIAVVIVLLLIALNQGKGPAPLPGNVVDSSGGIMTALEGAVRLDFPSGAVLESTAITVEGASYYPTSSKIVPGTIYEFGPNGTQFERPVQLTIEYDPSEIPAGTEEGELGIALATSWHGFTGWLTLPDSAVDTDANTVTAPITSFSTYGVSGEGHAIVSDEYEEWMENPPFELSGSVGISPSPSVICEPGGEMYVQGVYIDAEGRTIGYDEPPYPVYIWYLEGGTGSIHHGEEPEELWAPSYTWIPSAGVIVLRAPADAGGKKGKLTVRVDIGWKIVAETEITVEFLSGARVEPKPAYCPVGSMVQLDCKSPYNFIYPYSEHVRFEWATTGAFGMLLGDDGLPHTSYSGKRTIIYKANRNAPPGASDSVRVSVYVGEKLKAENETLVLISGMGVTLRPVPDFQVEPGQRLLISCGLPDERPEGELVFDWSTTGRCGSLWYPDPKEPSVWYRGNDDALDCQTDNVTVRVSVVQGEVEVPLGTASTKVEIYNPQTIYNFCSDPLGEKWLKGGSQWEFHLVGHGPVGGGFRARPGENIRVICVKKGADPGDVYLRVGRVGDGPTGKTQLLLKAGELYDGLDMTFKIQLS